MDVEFYTVLLGLGLAGGLASGLVGLGGGIIMVPLLLYVPPALGMTALSMKVVAGMTSVQSFAGALSGALGHRRHNRISPTLALWLGVPMTAGSLAGSVASDTISSELMLLVFAGMAIVAAVMMVLPRTEDPAEPDPAHISFNRPLTVSVGLVIGVLSGVVGQGGSFLFIPAMLYLLHIPTRIAIGTALAVGVASSIAVLLGRIGTSQIPFALSAVLVAGVLIGAQIGSHLSQRTPRRVLRGVLSALIAATAAKICYQLVVV